MEFSRQEYWSGLPFASAGNLPDPGIKPRSPELQADALLSEPPGNPTLLFPLSANKLTSYFIRRMNQSKEKIHSLIFTTSTYLPCLWLK